MASYVFFPSFFLILIKGWFPHKLREKKIERNGINPFPLSWYKGEILMKKNSSIYKREKRNRIYPFSTDLPISSLSISSIVIVVPSPLFILLWFLGKQILIVSLLFLFLLFLFMHFDLNITAIDHLAHRIFQ